MRKLASAVLVTALGFTQLIAPAHGQENAVTVAEASPTAEFVAAPTNTPDPSFTETVVGPSRKPVKASDVKYKPSDINLVIKGDTCFIDTHKVESFFEDVYGRTYHNEFWSPLEAEHMIPYFEEFRKEQEQEGIWSNWEQKRTPFKEYFSDFEIQMAEAEMKALKECAAYTAPTPTTTVLKPEPAKQNNTLAIIAIIVSAISAALSAVSLALPFFPQLKR
ncbi:MULTISPECIES: hypothetical protein [unclassified Corynebacterium]|uniref:hypothetical protein n=1 Tax=unclassified Corynebacterium TaxID=2624378 RepID=UPI0008A18A97|nr:MULTISPECIES: hypothetical protein [unclassified Corynebacterium]